MGTRPLRHGDWVRDQVVDVVTEYFRKGGPHEYSCRSCDVRGTNPDGPVSLSFRRDPGTPKGTGPRAGEGPRDVTGKHRILSGRTDRGPCRVVVLERNGRDGGVGD